MKSTGNSKFIFICTGSDCKKAGSKKILKEANNFLKRDKKQMKIRFIKTKCMDYCKKAPNAIVENTVHHKITIEELQSIL